MVLLKISHGQDDLQRRPQRLNVRFPPQPSTTTSPEGILYLSKNSNATCLNIKPDTPINVYTRFCLNTAKSKFSLVSPVAD